MPYEMFEQDGEFCLRNQQTGKMVPGSCHKMKADTMAMMRALYANVPDARTGGKTMEGDWVDGGEVKALGEGKVGGYLVRFSTESDPDLTNDFFTPETDFFLDEQPKAWVLYDHGRDAGLKARKLGHGTMRIDDVGVWIETQLKLRDAYEKAIYELAKKGKLGWSSGSLTHLVEREPQGKAFRIVTWPIGEASLTPNPAEFRNRAFSLKSFVDQQIWQETVLTPDPETKAEWSAAYMNDLPDSSFAYIEDGGEKDSEGKTKPRSLRHFPYKDANGKLDEAHVRNALARIPQSSVSDAAKAKALGIIKRAARTLGIDVSGGKSMVEVFEGLSALQEIIAPIDLKGGLDASSEAVEAAVDELIQHERLVLGAVKSHVARIEHTSRLRLERDGRRPSEAKRQWVATAREHFARIQGHYKELDENLEQIQKRFETSDAEHDAATQAARHELLRTQRIVAGFPPAEGA